MAMTKEEEQDYLRALARARAAETRFQSQATGWPENYDIGGQGGSVRGRRNITGLLDDVLNVSTGQNIDEGIPIHDKVVQSLFNEPQTALTRDDVGYWEGLNLPFRKGRTSEEEQRQIAGNMYPDRGKELGFFSNWRTPEFWDKEKLNLIPGVGPTDAEWATQQVNRADDSLRASQRNMLHRAEGNALGIGTPSYRAIPEEKGFVSTAFDSFKKYFKDFDSPSKGVCTLPGGTATQQLDRAACDAAGGTFNSPQMISDANTQSEKWYNENYVGTGGFGFPLGAIKTGIEQLNHMRDAINDAQVNDNIMQKAGMEWTPDKIAWIEKYGIRNLPGTQFKDDIGGDTVETAVGRDTAGKFFSSQEGLLSPDELQLRYPQRYSDNTTANKAIFDAANQVVIDDNRTEQRNMLHRAERDAAKLAQIQAGIDADAGRTTQENYELYSGEASIWADKAIDAAQKRGDDYVAGIWADKAIPAAQKRGEDYVSGLWADKAIDAEEQRLANIQADEEWRVEEAGELFSSGMANMLMTPDSLLDGVTEAMETDPEKANTITQWIADAADGIITIGSIIVDKVLGLGDNDNDGLEENEVETIVEVVKDLAEQSKVEATTEVKQQDGLLVDPAKTTTSAVLDTNIFTATAASTEGFTMDRLKNPLSPENKAWWLGGGGGVPGNNRAVQFFEALAYIGTPWKYRPDKTPAQQNIANQIKARDDILDYKAAEFSALNTSTKNSYSQLKNMILQPTEIAKQLLLDDSDDSLFSRLFFGGLKGEEKKAKANSDANLIHTLMHELAMNGILPTMENAEKLWLQKNPPPVPNTADTEATTQSDGGGLDYFKSKIPFIN